MNQDEILIIGIGNIFRGDDLAGLAAARLLKDLQLPGVRVLEIDGDISILADAWEGSPRVVLIDAVASQSEAGRIFRFEAQGEPLPRRLFASCCSCHAFGLAEQVEIARSLQQIPPSLIVYGIEGKDFMLGSGLSPEVQEALPRLVARIQQDLGLA
jgi:hydrogenase maturation protease